MNAPIMAMLARGAGNSIGNNFCADVGRRLDPKIFYIRENTYFAEIRPIGMRTMPESIDNFADIANDMLKAKPFWMGVGYSLGAAALNRFVRQLALSKCKGIGLLSDPYRHRDQWMGTRRPAGVGIAGEGYVGRKGGYPVWTYSAPNDPISEIRPEGGLRIIGAGIGAPSGEGPRPDEYARAFADPLLIRDLINYGPGGRHTCYPAEKVPGTNVTYVQHLADQMNAEGRRLVAAGLV